MLVHIIIASFIWFHEYFLYLTPILVESLDIRQFRSTQYIVSLDGVPKGFLSIEFGYDNNYYSLVAIIPHVEIS